MNTASVDEVLQRLEREDVVPTGTRERATEVLKNESPGVPWYARGLTGFYGWLAAVCFAGYVYFEHAKLTQWLAPHLGGAWTWRLDAWICVAIGLCMAGAAIVMRRLRPRGYFAYLSLALALAGESVATHSYSQMGYHGTVGLSLFVLVLELVLMVAYPDSLMRLLCTVGACAAAGRLWDPMFHRADPLLLGIFAGGLLLFWLQPRLAKTPARHAITPIAFGMVFAACAWMLVAMEKYSEVSLGSPVRVGVAVIAFVAVAAVLPRKRFIPLAAIGVGALAALSFGSPGVLAAIALLAVGFHRREPKLIATAAVFLALFYSYLYYSLDQTLLVKSGLLLGNGLCFLLLWRIVGGERLELAAGLIDRRIMAMAVAGALVVVNGLIVHKERVIDTGAPVLVALRPVDPRSLIEGDYMTLRYGIADRYDEHRPDGRIVVALDVDGVASFVRWDDGQPLKTGERLLRYRERAGRMRLGAEAFFFQEGKGDLYANAKYGELRVTRSGDSVLVGLRDGQRHRLGRALR